MNTLVPLRIPQNWAITYNSFFDDEELLIIDGEIQNYLSFKEDVLFIEQCARNDEGTFEIAHDGLFVDLGWYPDSDPDGEYVLKMCKSNWNNEIFQFRSKSKKQITLAIELCLEITDTELFNESAILHILAS